MGERQIGAEFIKVDVAQADDLVEILQRDPYTQQYVVKNITISNLVTSLINIKTKE